MEGLNFRLIIIGAMLDLLGDNKNGADLSRCDVPSSTDLNILVRCTADH